MQLAACLLENSQWDFNASRKILNGVLDIVICEVYAQNEVALVECSSMWNIYVHQDNSFPDSGVNFHRAILIYLRHQLRRSAQHSPQRVWPQWARQHWRVHALVIVSAKCVERGSTILPSCYATCASTRGSGPSLAPIAPIEPTKSLTW